MKKLLLFTISLFGISGVVAQTDCASALPLVDNATYTAADYQAGSIFQTGCLGSKTNIKTNWYSFTPTANGEITISSNLPDNDGTSYTDDTRISVFSGDCTTMTCLGTNDDISATNYLSELTIPVEAGVTYYVQWDNYWYVGDTTGLEDLGFLFNFTFNAVACVRPSSFDFYRPSGYTTTDATLAWENAIGDPANYDIDWSSTFATAAGAGTIVSVPAATATTYTLGPITGLPTSSNFRYYVRSSCDTASQSAWQGPFYGYLAKTLPYSNTFESSANNYTDGFIGFSRLTTSATSTPANYADGGAGNSMYTFNSTTAVSNIWAYSRAISLSAGEAVTITFKTRLYATATASPMKIAVTVGNTQASASQTTVLSTITESSKTAYTLRTATYTAPAAGIYYFGFHNISLTGTTQTYLFFDTLNITSVLSVDAFDNSKVTIAPNPATNYVNITNSSDNSISSVELTDLNGRIIRTVKFEGNETQINISDLSQGVYMMKINSDKGSVTKKLVKE